MNWIKWRIYEIRFFCWFFYCGLTGHWTEPPESPKEPTLKIVVKNITTEPPPMTAPQEPFEPKFIRYIKTLPTCPSNGWPRFCPHREEIQFSHEGTLYGGIAIRNLVEAEMQNIAPEVIVKKFLEQIRSTYH